MNGLPGPERGKGSHHGRIRAMMDHEVASAATAPDALSVAHLIVDAASDKKAQDILLLDVRGVASFTDYFVVCEGSSERQIRAIAEGVDEELARHGVEPYRREVAPAAGGVLFAFPGAVVSHFLPWAPESC